MNTKPLLHFAMLLLALATGLLGCMSRPPLVRQTFALHAPPVTNSALPQKLGVLAIRTLEVSPLFEGRSFVYRTGPDRYQVDPYAGFLIAPTRALAIPLRNYFRQAGMFKNVVEAGSQLGADTFLEVYVTELYGDFRPSAEPAAVLSLRLLFFDAASARTHQPFLDKHWVHRVPLPEKTAPALVAGWNQALTQTMTAVAADLQAAQVAQTRP